MKKCKVCKKEYEIKKRNKCHFNGYCSYSCYKKTDEFKVKFKKTFIKNREQDIHIDSMGAKDIDKLFHKLKSESVKKSQEKRVKTIRSKGSDEFSRMTKLGNNNRKKKFLINNNIVNKLDDLSQEEIDRLFVLHFNTIEKHGNKIKKGICKKYGQQVSREFKRRYKKAFCNFLNRNNIDLNGLTVSEYKKEIEKFNKKHAYKDVLQWKKTHLKNQLGITVEEIEKLSGDEVCKKYSQYLCDRMKLVDNIYNGYRRTKKGYYIFKNVNKKIFYRSSWEQMFLKEVDLLIGEGEIDSICVPKYIHYKYGGIRRKYYPDFKIEFNDKFKIVEIKPFKRVNDSINKAKFKSAKKIFKNNFLVLTEKEVFSDLRREILDIIKG